MNDTCSVTDCSNPIKRFGYCYGHYMKNWRYGTPTPQHPDRWVDIRGKVIGTLTVTKRVKGGWLCLCSCGNTRIASAGELNRTGDRNTCGAPGAHLDTEPRYAAAHDRVARLHGPASQHPCVDCGNPARHWSYDHNDPDELYAVGLSANPMAYSANPDHYEARCVPCHKRYDLGRRDSA